MIQQFIGQEYSLDPDDIKFNDRFVGKNKAHTGQQYETTKYMIQQYGQTHPIFILNGECIDGRHRTKIAKELGRGVKCIDVNPDLPDEELVVLCNINTMSGRDYNASQRAIFALYNFVVDLKLKAVTAAKMSKVDKRLISYASTIRGLGRDDILETLLEGKKVKLSNMTKASGSLEVLCKFCKAESEEGVVEDTSKRVHYNPDSLIETEKGKAWYAAKKDHYKYLVGQEPYIEWLQDMIELANYKYSKEVKYDPETGEILQ